jgi:DNA repair protein RadC
MKTDLDFNYSVVSEVQLSYRSKVPASKRPVVTSSEEGYELLMKIWNEDTMSYREEFHVLALNRANKVIAHTIVSQGGTAGTVVDSKMVFQFALKTHADGLILAHNHPSGNTRPSSSDISLTKKLVGAGKLLDIRVLDHLIITSEEYFSFQDEGLM